MKKRRDLTPFILFLISLTFYWQSLAPTVLWGDSARLAIEAKKINWEFNLMGGHVLHAIFGNIFSRLPFTDFAFKQNFMSAFFACLTILFLYLVVKKITRSKISAFLTALSYMVSHMFWLLAVINEHYTLGTFFIILQIYLLLIWKERREGRFLYLFFFCLGLSLVNDLLPLYCLPGYIYFILIQKKRIKIIPILTAFLGGASILIYLCIKYSLSYGFSLRVVHVLKWAVNWADLFPSLIEYPRYLLYQFPVFGFLLGLIGIYHSFRKKKEVFIFLALLFLVAVLLTSPYMRQRRFNIFVLSYLIYSIWIGIGIDRLFSMKICQAHRKIVSITSLIILSVLPVIFYYNMPALAKRFGIGLGEVRRLHFRDNYRFYLFPAKKGEYGAYNYGKLAFENLEPESVILADFNPGKVLEYFQKIDGKRPDVKLKIYIDGYYRSENPEERIIGFIDKHIKQNPVYLADDYEKYYFCNQIKKRYNLIPSGSLFKIEEK